MSDIGKSDNTLGTDRSCCQKPVFNELFFTQATFKWHIQLLLIVARNQYLILTRHQQMSDIGKSDNTLGTDRSCCQKTVFNELFFTSHI